MSTAIDTSTADQPLVTADGRPLKESLNRALRQRRIRAFTLTAPLLIFLVIMFVLPIIWMLSRAVDNPEVVSFLPKTVVELQKWDETGTELPPEPVFAALAADFKDHSQSIGKVGKRLNYEIPGMSSLFRSSARKVRRIKEGPYKEAFLEIRPQWGYLATWRLIKRESASKTSSYMLSAVDMRRGELGGIERQPKDRRIYLKFLWRTVFMSVIIVLLTILLGYPIAYLLATLPMRYSSLLMILVLLPFWTSLLVRTSAWIILLQNSGVVNDLLVTLGLISEEGRLALMHNKTGTFIAMTHILLPFMILPLYSVMRTIPPSYMRAARSMGATQFRAFTRVYMPLTVSGIGAGTILVFILAIGYYITPQLVGGTTGIFISNEIDRHFQSSGNWGLAAALGAILLALVLLFYYLYDKVVGIDNMKLG